jgi:hypothetical protein
MHGDLSNEASADEVQDDRVVALFRHSARDRRSCVPVVFHFFTL